MNKNLNLFSLFVFGLTSLSHGATEDDGIAARKKLIGEQIISQSPTIKLFDGKGFGGSDEAIRKKLAVEKYSNVDLTSKGKRLLVSNVATQYQLTWDTQEFESGPDLRLNQISFNKADKKINLKTVSFNGPYINTITTCKGHVAPSTGDIDTACATATKVVCKSLISSFEKTKSLNPSRYSTAGSIKLLDERISACQKVNFAENSDCLLLAKNYSQVLKDFTKKYDQNAAVSNQREQLMKEEDKQIETLLGNIKTGGKVRTVSHLKKDTLHSAIENLPESLDGLVQIHDFVSLCEKNKNSFPPDYYSPSKEERKTFNQL
jgi:hypothetical protein